MLTPAIPTDLASFDAYLYNWKTLLTASPTTFGLTAPDAVAITAQYTAFHAAYQIALAPETRTAPAVAEQSYRKALALILLRQQYNIIKANPSVTIENKTAIGVRVNDPVPSPIPAPVTAPVIVARNSGPLQMLVELSDFATPTTRRKPDGAVGAIVVKKVGVTPETNPDLCQWEGMYSRSPFYISGFAPGDVGKYVTFFSRWVNAKGEEGPWSAAFSQIISN
jgi:hypothetical protein